MECGKEKTFKFLKSIGKMKEYETFQDYNNRDNPNWNKDRAFEEWKQDNLKTDKDRRIFASWDGKDRPNKVLTAEEIEEQAKIDKENEETEIVYSKLFPEGLIVKQNK